MEFGFPSARGKPSFAGALPCASRLVPGIQLIIFDAPGKGETETLAPNPSRDPKRHIDVGSQAASPARLNPSPDRKGGGHSPFPVIPRSD